MDRKALLLVTFFVEGGLFVFGLVLMGGSGAEMWSQFSLSWNATAYALLLCIPMFAALYVIMRSSWEPIVQLKEEIDEKVLPIFSKTKLIDLAIIAFFAGVGEELFFRGWMQSVLINKSGIWIGILITSAIFGLLHYLSKAYAIYAFVTGIYLGVIYYASGNLFIVMGIHAIYDFVALVCLVKKGEKETGDSSLVTDKISGGS